MGFLFGVIHVFENYKHDTHTADESRTNDKRDILCQYCMCNPKCVTCNRYEEHIHRYIVSVSCF